MTIREAVLKLLRERGTRAQTYEVFREVTLTDFLHVIASRLDMNESRLRKQALALSINGLVRELRKPPEDT